MATKLKNLKVTKVDFVDEGANQRADIKIFKRKDDGGEEVDNQQQQAESVSDALADNIVKKIIKSLSAAFKKPESVQKEGASAFMGQMSAIETEKIRDEIWSVCYALQQSLGSVISDPEMDASDMLDALNENIDDFHETIKRYASTWASGDPVNIRKNLDPPDEIELPLLKEMVEKARVEEKGELEEMLKIDKSKMTPEERTTYEEIIKKYAVESQEEEIPVEKQSKGSKKMGGESKEVDEEETDKKKDGCKKSVSTGNTDTDTSGDIYKGLHPAVKAEMEALRKFREESETRELTEVAKKYTVIGKKPEELVPTLKSLRAAGGSAYDDMIAILDSAVTAMEQTGVFSEIGKSREGGPVGTMEEAINKARAKAAEIRKAKPNISYAQAMDEALLENPELLAELDK